MTKLALPLQRGENLVRYPVSRRLELWVAHGQVGLRPLRVQPPQEGLAVCYLQF